VRDLPGPARAVVWVVTVLGVGLWLGLISALRPVEPQLALAAALFFVAAVATEFLVVPVRSGGIVSVSTIVHLAGILVLPWPIAVTLAGGAVACEQVLRRAPWYKATFNLGSVVLTLTATGLAQRFLGDPLALADAAPLRSVLSLFVVALTYYVVTSGLLALLMSRLAARPLLYVVRVNLRSSGLLEASTAVVGGLVGFIWSHTPWWTLAMLIPAALAYLALRYLHQVLTETHAAVETIAGIVDERDRYTYEHSCRVAEYADLLARALRLDPDEIEAIISAARVHDLGKIGVGNDTLHKDGPLDERGWEEIEVHPAVGAQILGHFRGYRNGVRYVLHHHERWDGAGYPDGLKAEDIPLGARVIAVADAFDAMTTDRPYRRALVLGEALDRVRAAAGTQFDPAIAGQFLALEPNLRQILASRPVSLHARPFDRLRAPARSGRPAQVVAEAARPGTAVNEG
jgi:HD-GYP domain-containing protein (c-di-GMP phosphodiesterase class II)